MAGFWDFLSNPVLLNDIGTGVSIAGNLVSATGAQATGDMAVQAGKFSADQLRQNAGTAVAASQREAYFEDLNAKYVMSSALAAAAASGGGASDPTVVNIIAQTAALGAYKTQLALYTGKERARQYEMQADAAEYEGAVRKKAAEGQAFGQYFQAGTNLLKGLARDASMFQRFGGGGPFAEG